MKTLLFLTLLIPVAALAQAYKCTDAAGRVTYAEAPCQGAAKAVPISIHPAAQSAVAPKDPAASMRMETIQLMLSNGKIGEARVYARTAEERALVASVASAEREQRKASLAEIDAAERRRQREIDKGQKVRSVLR